MREIQEVVYLYAQNWDGQYAFLNYDYPWPYIYKTGEQKRSLSFWGLVEYSDMED